MDTGWPRAIGSWRCMVDEAICEDLIGDVDRDRDRFTNYKNSVELWKRIKVSFF